MAQLGERLLRMQEVRGSNPLSSTRTVLSDMKKEKFIRFFAHLFAILSASWLAYRIRTEDLFFSVDDYLLKEGEYEKGFILCLLLWSMLLAKEGLYRRHIAVRIGGLFRAHLQGMVILMAAGFLYHDYSFSRGVALLFGIGGFFFLLIFNALADWLIKRNYENGHWLVRVCALTTPEYWKELCDGPLKPGFGYKPVGYFGQPGLGNLGSLDDIFSNMDQMDEVFADLGLLDENWWHQFRIICESRGVNIKIIPQKQDILGFSSLPIIIDGVLFLGFRDKTASFYAKYGKRMVDLVGSVTILLITSPLIVFSALLIKLNSKGPIMIRQQRTGRNGQAFEMYKLRTMYADTALYALTSRGKDKDPRITPIGLILRRFCIDELPQLLNVIMGDMSLVGPRPEMEFIVNDYSIMEKRRLALLPGITGLWQVQARALGRPIHEHVKYDLYYLENLSFAMDLDILIRTLKILAIGH